MRQVIGYALKTLSVALAAGLIMSIFLAYFTATYNEGKTFDFFGRELSKPPVLVRVFITDENRWAGMWWHIGDLVVAVVGFYIAYLIGVKGSKLLRVEHKS